MHTKYIHIYKHTYIHTSINTQRSTPAPPAVPQGAPLAPDRSSHLLRNFSWPTFPSRTRCTKEIRPAHYWLPLSALDCCQINERNQSFGHVIRASSPPSAPPALACLARAGAREGWAGSARVREGGFSFSIWLSVSCAISAPLGYFLSSFCLLFILSLPVIVSITISSLYLSLAFLSFSWVSFSLSVSLALFSST